MQQQLTVRQIETIKRALTRLIREPRDETEEDLQEVRQLRTEFAYGKLRGGRCSCGAQTDGDRTYCHDCDLRLNER